MLINLPFEMYALLHNVDKEQKNRMNRKPWVMGYELIFCAYPTFKELSLYLQ